MVDNYYNPVTVVWLYDMRCRFWTVLVDFVEATIY